MRPLLPSTQHIIPFIVSTEETPLIIDISFKGALYRIWCGMNRLGDSGVKVV